MRKFISFAVLALMASSMSAQTVANMKDLSAEKKSAAVSLKLTGTLTTTRNSDFRQLRDLAWQLRDLNLSEATCPVLPKNAFHSRHHLQHIILPNQLQEIGSQAFFACDNLQEVVIPQSVTKVGAAAFSGCKSLKNITINGTPELGEFAFANLEGVKLIKVNSKIPPKAAATAFSGINMRGVKLVMPKGSEKLYRKAVGWNAFFGEVKQAREVCNPEACLIPTPMELKVNDKATPLQVAGNWKVVAADGLANEQEHAERILKERTGGLDAYGKNARKGGNAKQGSELTMTLALDESLPDKEAYTLEVQQKGVVIKGKTATGVFYGLMTFDQLLRGDASKIGCDAIPQLVVKDQPRTHVRELMVDPCRIFIPYKDLKAFVPEMARYKLNMLHLHLVDDQAWTIEIKKYPRLTAEASSRWGMDDMLMPIKGYYTQEQMRDFVAYCAKYHIQVVPEIEMPGHEVAAISVYPELTCKGVRKPIRTTCGVSDELLCPGNDFTYEFLGNVFKELADIFPSEYIHLGGDEAGNPALDCWTYCPKCQALKKKLGITTTDRSENWKLQGYLFDKVIDLLRTQYHKTPMFWYETDFKKIQPGCVTFAWRAGLTKEALVAAVENNARILLCPGEHCYFDYPMAKGDMPEVNWGMPVTSLKAAYSLDPAWGMGEEFEKNNLFGVAGTLWSECINSPERIYYQAYPRSLALAEAGWSFQKNRSWEGFLTRLKPTVKDMMRRGITFSMEY